ncbi:MAG: hypothetical protein ACO3F2_07980 [Roseiflexaceae bacterium]
MNKNIALHIAAISSLIWVIFSSYFLTVKWGWDTNEVFPVPLVLAALITWPLLTLIIHTALHIRTFSYSTLAIFSIYIALAIIIFTQIAPGCFPPDGLANFKSVTSGSWNAWNSIFQHPLLTIFMQIVPWNYNAPLLFLLLLWAIVLTFAHTILIRQNSHWVFHLLLFAITLTPAFVVSITNIVRDTYFTALIIGLVLLVYHTFKFHQHDQNRTIFVISFLGAFLILYRSDSAPLIGSIFVMLWITILQPSWISKKYPALQPWFIVRSRATNWKLLGFSILPILFIFTYSQIIPHSLLQKQYKVKGNSWTNNSQDSYQLTLIENPLSYILLQPNAILRPEYLTAIEQVYQVSDLQKKYCAHNICLFWSNQWNKKSTLSERNQLVRASFGIFLDNPLLFIHSRLATLNTVGGPTRFVQCDLVAREKQGIPTLYKHAQILLIGQTLVDYYNSALTESHMPTIYFTGKSVWYNVLVFMLISIPMLTWYRVEPILSLLMLFLLLRTLIVIIMAPAGLLTYYLALYIGVLVLYVFWLAALVARTHTHPNHAK